MVVRRTPGKSIRIIHEGTGDILTLRVTRIGEASGHRSLHVTLGCPINTYSIEWIKGCVEGKTPGEWILAQGGAMGIKHSSGQAMCYEVARIDRCDTDIRLVDKPRHFKFEWRPAPAPAEAQPA